MRQVVLLRGINLGSHKRISMAELRAAFASAGFEDVETYLQSGNVVLSSDLPAAQLAGECQRLVADRVGFEVDVLVRSHDELAEIVRLDPLGDIASNHKRYQVTFLAEELSPEIVSEIEALAKGPERLVAAGRELYGWHPDGVGRSKLAARLGGKGLGVTATARNWTTVIHLLEMAEEQ